MLGGSGEDFPMTESISSMPSKGPSKQIKFRTLGRSRRIEAILGAYSPSMMKKVGSATFAQYRISSSIKRKLRGTTQAPVAIEPKKASNQFMEFLPRR